MANGRQEIRTGQTRGRPVARDPGSERITIRFTETERQRILASARNEDSWRTLDTLTDSLVRIREAVQAGCHPDENQLGGLLDQVRILLVKTGPVL